MFRLLAPVWLCLIVGGCSDPDCAPGETKVGSTCHVVPRATEPGDAQVDSEPRVGVNWMDGGSVPDASSEDASVASNPSPKAAAGLSASLGVTCALHSDGSTSCWGKDVIDDSEVRTKPEIVPSLAEVNRIWLQIGFACARFPGKQLRCWGKNQDGQLGSADPSPRGEPVPIPGLHSVEEAGLGGTYACALEAVGTVKCWGSDAQFGSSGRLGGEIRATGMEERFLPPRQVADVETAVELKVGAGHACVRLLDGSVKCWGENSFGALGDGTRVSRGKAEPVPGITGALQLAVSGVVSCALLKSGQVMCWEHRLTFDANVLKGPGSTARVVEGLTDAIAISTASSHVCALRRSGAVSCWGSNSEGELGDGTTTSSSVPVQVVGLSDVVEVAAGAGHTCARLSSGGLRCWGDNQYGQLGDGTTLTRLTPVAVVGFE